MENLILLILATLLIIYFMNITTNKEKFSQSGFAISDRDCKKLADVYYKPKVQDPKCRYDYEQRICGKQRRRTIDPQTGNYFTYYGQLI